MKWTLLGQVAFGLCQWLMLIVLARLGPPEIVGQFILALAVTAPIILLIGLDLRTVQVTDQSNQYPFEDFFCLRVVTLAVAMAVIVAIAAWGGYKQDTALLIVVMGIAKCVEAMSELCHGALQQHERLDQLAKARIVRGVMSVIVLAIGVYLFHSLLWATAALALMWTGILICYDWPVAFRVLSQNGLSTRLWRFRPAELWQLLVAAFPTGILSCQASLEQNLPRLCIDGYLGERELGMFSAVASLTAIATMVINAVHCAALPRIAKYLVNHQRGDAGQILFKLSVFGAAVGSLGTVAAIVGGQWFLGLAYGSEYASQTPLLVVLMLGSTVRFATGAPLSTGFRAAKYFWLLTILQTTALIAAIPVLMLLVQNYQGMGAAYASIAIAVLFAALQIPAAIWLLRSSNKPQLECAEIVPFTNSPQNRIADVSDKSQKQVSRVA